MESGRAVLLIADIGGYTEYMSSHRMSLAHAEVNTARMLEKMIDAAPGFDLVEIEGDAAFLSRRADGDTGTTIAEILEAATAMHRAFHLERQYVTANLCPCSGCKGAADLKLKFVAHVGDVATQTIRERIKLVGIDVILVHRLLKNPVGDPRVRPAVRGALPHRRGRRCPSPCTRSRPNSRASEPCTRTSSTSRTSTARTRRCPRRPCRGASGGPSWRWARGCRT